MGVRWAHSADRHGISHEDALYAIAHAEALAEVDGNPGEKTVVYVGHPHGRTDRYIEVIAAVVQPRDLVIFHVMELSDVFRPLLSGGE